MNEEYKTFILEGISEYYGNTNTSLSRQSTLKIYKNFHRSVKLDKELNETFDNLKLKIELKKESLKQHIDDVFKILIEHSQNIEKKNLKDSDTKHIKRIFECPLLVESNNKLVNFDPKKIFLNLNIYEDSKKIIQIPNLDLLKYKFDLKAHKFNVQSIKIVDDKIISCGADFQVKIWDTKSNFSLNRAIQINSLAKLFDANDSEFTIGCKNGDILNYNINDGQIKDKICGLQRSITCFLNFDKQTLVIGDETGQIKVFNKIKKCFILTINAHKKSVLCLKRSNSVEILSGSSDKNIKLWNIRSGECLKSFNLHVYAVYCIEIIDENRFISCSWDKSIKIWDKATGNCIKTLDGHKGPVRWIELFENEEILSCSDDGTIKHWIDGKCFKTLFVDSGPLNCFKVLKNGIILIGCMNGLIKICN